MHQWGKYQSGGGRDRTATVTFPVTFSSACYAVVDGGIKYANGVDTPTTINAISTSSFNVTFDDYMAGAYWIAVGK